MITETNYTCLDCFNDFPLSKGVLVANFAPFVEFTCHECNNTPREICGACGFLHAENDCDLQVEELLNLLPSECEENKEGGLHYGCYQCACAHASEEQETTKIAEALILSGVPRVIVEQTGGFCMVVYAYSEDHKKALCAVPWGVLFCSDVENGDGDQEEILSESYGITSEDEKMTETDLQIITEIIKANL